MSPWLAEEIVTLLTLSVFLMFVLPAIARVADRIRHRRQQRRIAQGRGSSGGESRRREYHLLGRHTK